MKKLIVVCVALFLLVGGFTSLWLGERSERTKLTAKIEKQDKRIADLASMSKALSKTPDVLQRLLGLKYLRDMKWEQSLAGTGRWMCYLTLYSDGLSWKDITYSETGESPELAAIGVLKMIDEYRKKMCEALEEKP